jgi:hypothetical protein
MVFYNMRTLEVKQTITGQFQYRVVDSEFGEIVPPQYGTCEFESTLEGARSRFAFDIVEKVNEFVQRVR